MQLLEKRRNSKIFFYALLTLGSIGVASPSGAAIVKESMENKLASYVRESAAYDNAAVREVAEDVAKIYKLNV